MTENDKPITDDEVEARIAYAEQIAAIPCGDPRTVAEKERHRAVTRRYLRGEISLDELETGLDCDD
jgi:hypothetical protein